MAAYAEPGADVVCPPGLSEPANIRALIAGRRAETGRYPTEMKASLRAAELEEIGVRRISVGHSFAVACWTNFEREAQRFIDLGDLSPESFPAT